MRHFLLVAALLLGPMTACSNPKQEAVNNCIANMLDALDQLGSPATETDKEMIVKGCNDRFNK